MLIALYLKVVLIVIHIHTYINVTYMDQKIIMEKIQLRGISNIGNSFIDEEKVVAYGPDQEYLSIC